MRRQFPNFTMISCVAANSIAISVMTNKELIDWISYCWLWLHENQSEIILRLCRADTKQTELYLARDSSERLLWATKQGHSKDPIYLSWKVKLSCWPCQDSDRCSQKGCIFWGCCWPWVAMPFSYTSVISLSSNWKARTLWSNRNFSSHLRLCSIDLSLLPKR